MLAVLQGIILTMLYSRTPDSFIINLNDKEDDFLFATERYDRKILDTSKELMEESSIKTSSGGFCTGTWNYSVTKI